MSFNAVKCLNANMLNHIENVLLLSVNTQFLESPSLVERQYAEITELRLICLGILIFLV